MRGRKALVLWLARRIVLPIDRAIRASALQIE